MWNLLRFRDGAAGADMLAETEFQLPVGICRAHVTVIWMCDTMFDMSQDDLCICIHIYFSESVLQNRSSTRRFDQAQNYTRLQTTRHSYISQKALEPRQSSEHPPVRHQHNHTPGLLLGPNQPIQRVLIPRPFCQTAFKPPHGILRLHRASQFIQPQPPHQLGRGATRRGIRLVQQNCHGFVSRSLHQT